MTSLYSKWTATPQWLRLTSILTISSLTLFTAKLVYGYHRWKAIGAGGLPYNLKGYLMNLTIETLYARGDTTGLGVYDRPERYYEKWQEAGEGERDVIAKKRFLQRTATAGRRSIASETFRDSAEGEGHQRSVRSQDQRADNPNVQAYLSAFDDLAKANPDITEWRTSVLERRGRALFLKPSMPLRVLDQQTQREICHVHGSDLSGHVTLALADAREVIAQGWGERHRLSGTKRFLPLGYTMVYVPRTIEETEVYRRIFQAGVDYLASVGGERERERLLRLGSIQDVGGR